jgi:methionyl-tRNA formyltransferase
MEQNKICLIASDSLGANIIYNELIKSYHVSLIIIEEKESSKKIITRRIKKLGFTKVFGQLLFQILIAKPLSVLSRKRSTQILKEYQLNASPIPERCCTYVKSVNTDDVVELLKTNMPNIVVLHGTRIVSKKVLESTSIKFINIHAGITPKYRGVHGGYWAMANNDLKNFGVTLHFVDAGIDTGSIIQQVTISPKSCDNFATYPILQLALGVELLSKSLVEIFKNNIEETIKLEESKLWYHPTLFQYVYNLLFKKVK